MGIVPLMKPSNRNLILITLCVLLGFAAWYVYKAWVTPPPAQKKVEQPIPAAKLKAIKEKVQEIETAKESGDAKKAQKEERSLADIIGGRAGAMLRMAQDRNLPIEMYGKVTDQHDQPVAGAEVYMIVAGGGTFAPGSGPVKIRTDAAGMFRVRAKGQQISILEVSRKDLARTHFKLPSGSENSTTLDAVGRYGKEYSWHSYTTPDHPFVIHVWRVEEFGDARSDSGYLEPIPGGRPYERSGLAVTCEREQKKPNVHWRDQKGSWSITFRPINGGIQETNDIYLNEAPESGYQSELTVAMRRGDPNYKVRIQLARHYYYTANSGKLYGAFSATFEPYMYDDECRVNAEIQYNPTGSRNLAVKPKY